MSIKTHTKRALDAALDELKRDGYMVLAILLDQKSDELKPMGEAVEVVCNFTNDPRIVSAMLKESLAILADPDPAEAARLKIQ
jgi:hypothetical protein